jgi:hypothetical protein
MHQHPHERCSLYVGKPERFIALAKQKNSGVVFTYCFLLREAPIFKISSIWGIKSLDETIKLVNYIKSKLLESKLFSALCSTMQAAHIQILMHTEVRWYLEAGCFQSSMNCWKSLRLFSRLKSLELVDLLTDETWCNKVAFLAHVSQVLNTYQEHVRKGWKDTYLYWQNQLF